MHMCRGGSESRNAYSAFEKDGAGPLSKKQLRTCAVMDNVGKTQPVLAESSKKKKSLKGSYVYLLPTAFMEIFALQTFAPSAFHFSVPSSYQYPLWTLYWHAFKNLSEKTWAYVRSTKITAPCIPLPHKTSLHKLFQGVLTGWHHPPAHKSEENIWKN